MIHTRTRSRFYHDSPFKVSSPIRHKLATTPLRQPVKRRRLAISTLALNRQQSSSDTESDDGLKKGRDVIGARGLQARKGAARVRLKGPRTPHRDSPRKRKRSEGSYSPSDSEGWVETEDETGDLIAEDDQHLLQAAPAHSLSRLKKEELERLWKVAGMWPDEDDVAMEDGPDVPNGRQEKSKSELVDGILQFRRQSSLLASPALRPSSLGQPFTPRPSRSRTRSSRAASKPSSSDQGVEATPRPIPRTSIQEQYQSSEPTPMRPNRDGAKQRARLTRLRLKGTGRSDLKARLGVRHNEATPKGRSRRSSNRSSQYITTSEESGGEVADATRPRRSPNRQADSSLSHGNVRATPLIRRLRPRNRGDSVSSQASTEVDADDEDNADEHDPDSSSSRGDTVSTRRDRHERKAKQQALEALKHQDDSDMSIDDTEVAISDGETKQPTRRKSMQRASSSSSTRSLRSSDKHDVDSQDATRTTRSGKAFGNMQERVDEDDLEDDLMDEGEAEDTRDWSSDSTLQEATLPTLTRLRRDQLVQMCEARDLEVGGTKPQLAKALLEWRDERDNRLERVSSTGSQATARAPSPQVVEAIASHVHKDGQVTPVLLREHIHAQDPATPPRSEDDSTKVTENDLNLDLQELGLEDFTIKPEFLQKLEKIGSGGFKDVFVGKLRGRKVAISEFREHLSEMDIRELKLLAEFRHPNIVRFRGICIPEDSSQIPCMLVSELCENGDLFDYIRNVPPPPLKRVLSLMLDIARGLEYLHLRNPAVIHRDCKSTNILITRHGVAKVGDFGLARVKHSTRSMIRSLVGTVNWQAPELWHPHPRYDYKVDVFSAALVYWEMLSGWSGDKKYPWEGYNEHYIYDAVGQKHKRPSLAGLKKHWGAEPVNLIERMWHQDPAERPTMTDVVADLEALIAEC